MKKVLLIFCFIVFGASFVCADVQQEKPLSNDDLSNLFEKTLEYVNANPQFVDELINEIQNSPEFKNLFDIVSSQEETVPADIDFDNPKVSAFFVDKINNSCEYIQKIILNFGQSKQFASELAKEDSIKTYLCKKAEVDTAFKKKLYLLLPKQDKKALEEILKAPVIEEKPAEVQDNAEEAKEAEEIKEHKNSKEDKETKEPVKE